MYLYQITMIYNLNILQYHANYASVKLKFKIVNEELHQFDRLWMVFLFGYVNFCDYYKVK